MIGSGEGRGIGLPVPRNSANHITAETARRGPGKGERPQDVVSPRITTLNQGHMVHEVTRGRPERLRRSRVDACPPVKPSRIRPYAPSPPCSASSTALTRQNPVVSTGPICLAVVRAEAARPRHLFGSHISRLRVSKVLQPLPAASWIRWHVARK